MPAFNKVVLVGNLTSKPELKYTPSGTAVCNFRLAINRRYSTASGEKREEVCFIGIVAWGKTGENVAEYLDKGSPALIEGRLTSRDWETKGGDKRTVIEVVAETVQFLGQRKSGDGGGRAPAAARPGDDGYQGSSGGDEDVPF